MVSIFGKNGSAKKGEIVKEYEPGADYLGTFFTVRFGQSSSVSLFFIPADGREALFRDTIWQKILANNLFTVVGSGSTKSNLGNLRCLMYRQQISETEADEAVEELVSWYNRRNDFLEKYRNGQVCYTRQEIADAKRRGYTVFVKNDFGAGGYYEKPENLE